LVSSDPRRRWLRAEMLLWMLLVLLTVGVKADEPLPYYELIILGDLPGGLDHSGAYAINDDGRIAGESHGLNGRRPVFWEGSITPIDLGLLPGTVEGGASGINADGWVAGSCSIAWNQARAFVWSPDFGLVDLGLPPGFASVYATDINARGQVVGTAVRAVVGQAAYIWNPGTGFTIIGDFPGGEEYGIAWSINDAAVVVGVGQANDLCGLRAFRWSPQDGFDELAAFEGGPCGARALAVHESGGIAGSARTWDGSHAAMWNGGAIVDLGELPGGDVSAVGRGINGAGEVVGTSSVNDFDSRAVRWKPGAPLLELGKRLVSNPEGWLLTDAYDVNAAGWIVGIAQRPAGGERGFLLKPVAAACRADLDRDGVVGQGDLGILLAHYGATDVLPEQGDMDGDEDVDQADLGFLLAYFGESC